MSADLVVVRLTLALLNRGELAIARALDPRRSDLRRVRRALACAPRETRFARALLERRTNLWIFRTSQHAFGGDFVLVDASEPRAEERFALVLELKRGEPVSRVSTAMHQARNARVAVAAIASTTRALAPDAAHAVVVGDPDKVLALLGGVPGDRTPRVPLARLGAERLHVVCSSACRF